MSKKFLPHQMINLAQLDRLTISAICRKNQKFLNDSANNCYKSLVHRPHQLATMFPAKSHRRVLILGGKRLKLCRLLVFLSVK